MMKQRGNGEGSVYRVTVQRKAGPSERWVAQVVVDGKLKRTFHPTEAKAKTGLRAMQHTVTAGAVVADGNVTVAEVLTRWRERSLAGRDLSPKTVVAYEWALERLADELGSKRLAKLTVDDIEKAFDRMVAGDKDHGAMGRSSLIKVRSVLGQALDFAVKRKMIASNPCRLADLTPTAERAKPRRSLTVVQAKRLLAEIVGHRLEALFAIMLGVGLRPGEVAGLTWESVDLDGGRIAIRHGVRVENNRAVLVDELKTSRSRRTIDLPPFAADALRRHRAAQTRERLKAASWADERLVFSTGVGTVLDPGNVARTLDQLTEKAGLGHWAPNELRHSAASLLSAAGVPLEHVADLLGHTNTRMLEQTYRHAVQPSINAAAGPMESLLG